ncbi:cysteine desulfurase family protein [Candidatus Poriferisodalis sp.]|uniref:cysteine desulfurase family protein n=1 Tax=Candidatus Poriferisodalis sp. TaxID=3101277 RepID=UPI003B5199CB
MSAAQNRTAQHQQDQRPAYLDCAASTPMRPCAVEAMVPFLETQFANPSGAHRMARRSRAAIDDAREVAAHALGFDPHGIVFTSGGTEADNLAVHGVTSATGTTALCPATEHHAVLHPVEAVGGRKVRVDAGGVVDLEHLAAQLHPDAGPPVGLVSVMLVNNESGVVADLDAVAEVVRRHAPDATLHTDAVQGVNWVDVAAAASAVDLLSLSAHKFGGPKGVGLLAVRPEVPLSAQLLGGGQEADRRSGTHNTAGIAALGAALAELTATRDADVCRIGALAARLAVGLLGAIDGCAETVTRSSRAAGICQLLIEDIETEALLVLLDRFDVMASAAASCASGAMEPSHVLAAMGVDRQAAAGSLRLSLGWCTEPWEIDRAIEAIPQCVKQLR